MKFVRIKPGRFWMGSKLNPAKIVQKYGDPEDQEEWWNREHPRHEVTINEMFYLQATEVTQGQWKEVMGDNPSHFNECGDDCPVERVSWEDAHIFINKLNEIEETDKYRLPTEAEWEYACRAGTNTVFSFGDDVGDLNEYAWYSDNSETQAHQVGTKTPNPWGLYEKIAAYRGAKNFVNSFTSERR